MQLLPLIAVIGFNFADEGFAAFISLYRNYQGENTIGRNYAASVAEALLTIVFMLFYQ